MRRQRGFSLVEVLMALLVLAIVITTTLAMFVERSRRLQQASETILVYQVLANEAEAWRRIPYSALAPSPNFITDTTLLNPLKPFKATVAVAQTQTDIKNVTLTIRWSSTRVQKLVLVRTDTGGGNLW
jgi:prepilin-type N-terminal cleavage/methylation domain-containing protein